MDERENCLLPLRCEHCSKYTAEHTVQYRGKRIKPYTYYCTAERRVRILGTRFDWVGESPEDCPLRKLMKEGGADGGADAHNEPIRDGRADPLHAGYISEA